jgi:hypothetical protein
MVDDFLKKIQNPKFRGFCVKVEKRFYYYCHTETGEFMWTATNPPPKKKKKPVKGLGLGGGGGGGGAPGNYAIFFITLPDIIFH